MADWIDCGIYFEDTEAFEKTELLMKNSVIDFSKMLQINESNEIYPLSILVKDIFHDILHISFDSKWVAPKECIRLYSKKIIGDIKLIYYNPGSNEGGIVIFNNGNKKYEYYSDNLSEEKVIPDDLIDFSGVRESN